jgi:hypothetical protein
MRDMLKQVIHELAAQPDTRTLKHGGLSLRTGANLWHADHICVPYLGRPYLTTNDHVLAKSAYPQQSHLSVRLHMMLPVKNRVKKMW